MCNIAFAFDLHNTLLPSNDAWIEAYMELSGGAFREEVTKAIYRKRSRREIAETIHVCYDDVYKAYCKNVRPTEDILSLLSALKKHFPLYLISAASAERVYNDLAPWDGCKYFDLIFTKETFQKEEPQNWLHLVEEKELDLMIYIGNDVEEDVHIIPQVISFICGDFVKKLNDLNLLINREEV